MIKRFLAFTLAETLVVMAIIGVVASLTIPNLNQSTQNKEKIDRVMKIYSNLEDAYGRAVAIYGPIDEWFANCNDNASKNKVFAERILDYLQVVEVCGFDKCCFSSKQLIMSNGTPWYEDNYCDYLKSINCYTAKLADGASIGFEIGYHNVYGYDKSEGILLYRIKVDIDGSSLGKNQTGSDIFDFTIADDDKILYPSIRDLYGEYSSSSDCYVTAWVVKNGNMDYFKCPKDLNWDTKTSCN